ncbi:HIT family protein [Candidatus Accumulibacter sp. ACC003]|uniref:HIT family protein n=1 Tax=Candidatus Accumulibacter sp. ACC003 TaxID=2823334 RepID=UPI0025BE682B|nr:HIT family protein [Candidatus Accumulibacter sp. ACC003]
MSRDAIDDCELCGSPGGEVVWESACCRVVMVADADYPGFCRVVLNRHLREMTDLPHKERMHLMTVVFAVETALRCLYQPDKINLASLGNVTPHVHWHLIPRWRDDRHFPNPVWATPQRANVQSRRAVDGRQLGDRIIAALRTPSSVHHGSSGETP